MELYKEVNKVSTKEDFINFIEFLIEDFKNNNNEWENKTITEYLTGINSWVDDMEGYFINRNITIPDNINWNLVANIFYSGKIYE